MPAIYTQNFKEEWALVAQVPPASISGATDLAARVDISPYVRLAIVIHTAGAEVIDVDLEQANALTAGTLKTLGAALDYSIPATAGVYVKEIRSEQFDTNPGIPSVESFKWFNVEVTPAGANVTGIMVLGLPKDQPPTDGYGTNGAAV